MTSLGYIGAGSILRRLPYDAEVEYLESTGTQWIDTGFPMRNEMTIDARVLFSANRWQMVTSGYDYYKIGIGMSDAKWSLTYKDKTVTGGDIAVDTWYDITAMLNKGISSLVVDGEQVASISEDSTIRRTSTLGLFCRIRYSGSAIDGYMYGKIAYARYRYSGFIVRDFIPVRFTNEKGEPEGAMYDRLGVGGMNRDGSARTDGLYLNRGTGAFLYGKDIL